jgi:hypothetical protein
MTWYGTKDWLPKAGQLAGGKCLLVIKIDLPSLGKLLM